MDLPSSLHCIAISKYLFNADATFQIYNWFKNARKFVRSDMSLCKPIKSVQSHSRLVGVGWAKVLTKNIAVSKIQFISPLHLSYYLDGGSLHPILCLIHPLNSIQPLLEITTMMMIYITQPAFEKYTLFAN